MKKPRKKKDKNQGQPSHPTAPVSSASATSLAYTSESEPEGMPVEELDESAEPTFSRMALPMVIIPLLGFLVYFADMYLIDNSGKFSAMVYDPNHDIPKVAGANNRLEKGKFVYERKAQCVTCHGPTGDGSKSQNAPPLAGSEWVLAEGPNRLIRIVLDGLTGPIEVKGEPWGAGSMLAWKTMLTDDDIADVLTYIRQTWGNKAAEVTPEQVKAVREAEASRSVNWTAAELLQILDK